MLKEPYGTRGTLRPTKKAEDYNLEQMDKEMEMLGRVVAFAIIAMFIVAGIFSLIIWPIK